MYFQSSWNFPSSKNITVSTILSLILPLAQWHLWGPCLHLQIFMLEKYQQQYCVDLTNLPLIFIHSRYSLRYRLTLYIWQTALHQQNKNMMLGTNDAVKQIWLNSQYHQGIIVYSTFSSSVSTRIVPVYSEEYILIVPWKRTNQFLFATTIFHLFRLETFYRDLKAK